jgi:flagellar biosynthesis protein FlhG
MPQDQAYHLRELSKSLASPARSSRVFTVASGKGGVGKSNFALNLALCLTELGKKVIVIDLDIGMANLDILMGVKPEYHLTDMVRQKKSIWDVIENGVHGVEYVAGGSGFHNLIQFTEEERSYLFAELEKLHGYADMIIIDTGAGLNVEAQQCHLAADEIFLLTTPEPTAMADAYSVAKILYGKNPSLSFQLVINRTTHLKDGVEVAGKFKMVFQRFLNQELKVFGALPDDPLVGKAVLKQEPFYTAYPHSQASISMKKLAQRLLYGTSVAEPKNGVKEFIQKLSLLLKK